MYKRQVVNTGTDSNVIITLLNETSEEPDKTGNTAYAGSIEGAAQLVKDGEQLSLIHISFSVPGNERPMK